MTAQGLEPYNHHQGRAPLLRPAGALRMGAFLALSLAGYLIVNLFWQHLVTGQWIGFSLHTYRSEFVIPLGRMFRYPLDIFTHPWMILVHALLLSVVIFVPIVVAVLYRTVFAAIFAAIVLLIGRAPVLAATLTLGFVLAALTRWRSNKPFLAMLLGLVPVPGYFYLFAFAGTDLTSLPLLQQWAMTAPVIIAVALAVAAAAAVLGLARLTHYRPGVIWPVLAVLLAAPLAIFYLKVGSAELAYSLLEAELAPGDAVFRSVPLEAWREHNRGLAQQTLENQIQDEMDFRRHQLIGDCEQFVKSYPRSERMPAVLWIQAQASSLQWDKPSFQNGLIRYTASYPLPASEPIWRRLLEEYGASPQAALAHWRLGQLALAAGNARSGYEHLRAADESLQKQLKQAKNPPPATDLMGKVFSQPTAAPSRDYYAEALFEVERLAWLVAQNNLLNDARCAQAMADYLRLNRHQMSAFRYYEQLSSLAGEYEDTHLGDNLKLAVAMATANLRERADQLAVLAQQQADPDAAIEANYQLGQLLVQKLDLQPLTGLPGPKVYFERVMKAPPNPWQGRAAERLAEMQEKPKETEE